jgi:hypothetical protein
MRAFSCGVDRALLPDGLIANEVKALVATKANFRLVAMARSLVLGGSPHPRPQITVVTVETVQFTAAKRVDFRLVRGPVAYVVERFELREREPATTALSYEGELGSDLLVAGAMVGGACRSDLDRGYRSELREDLRTGRRSVAGLAAAGRIHGRDTARPGGDRGPPARGLKIAATQAMTWPRTFARAVSSSPGRSL